MQHPFISPERLASADKILFVTHCAIGDFTYLQTYFKAFAKAYPHIKIDLWVDEVRRTRLFWRWKVLRGVGLRDWLLGCGIFSTVYTDTYSPSTLTRSLEKARAQKYPLVVSLCTLRMGQYARLARSISPNGFVVGMVEKTTWYQLFTRYSYGLLDARMMRNRAGEHAHINDTYASWFQRLFGLSVPMQERAPSIRIPQEWLLYAKLRFLKWGIDKKSQPFGRVVFFNAIAKTKKRCWPLSKLVTLMRLLHTHNGWHDITFLVNVLPHDYEVTKKFFSQQGVRNVILVSAQHNFYQLPAFISLCDIVVSVETSVMHLASALHVPVVALMRKKNPEWIPWGERVVVVTVKERTQWVSAIQSEQVLLAMKTLVDQHGVVNKNITQGQQVL